MSILNGRPGAGGWTESHWYSVKADPWNAVAGAGKAENHPKDAAAPKVSVLAICPPTLETRRRRGVDGTR